MSELKPEDTFQLHSALCRVSLANIGEAVIATDAEGRVTFLNPVAQSLTGWTQAEAAGVSLEDVFQIVHPETRQVVECPTVQALREGLNVGLKNRSLLIAKDGTERPIGPIDNGAVPIRDDQGEVAGAVLVFRDVTELYQQEQAKQAALAYADSIIATLREPFVVLDKSLRVKTANRAFYNTFHVQKEETEGRFIYDLGNGQWNIPRLRTLLDGVLPDHHAVQDFDVEIEFPMIGKKSMQLNARTFGAVKGQADLILLAIEDVTERTIVEAKLRASEERYRQVVELMPAGVYTVDAEGVITFYNQQAAAMWGRAPKLGDTDERFCGSTRLFRIDGAPMPHNQTPVAAALLNGTKVRDMEAIIERADGSRIHARVNIAPICDNDGNVIGAINVFDDVSQRKLVEVALQDSETRYRRLFETAKDGILILDTESGRITDANPFMSELLGYSHEHFLGKEMWEIGLFSDKAANETAVRTLQEKGYVRHEHLPLETSGGLRVDVEVVANAYREDHHKVIQCNIRDITERSRLEKQMQEQARALAELHRRKDEFLAMLSHELRNPLAPISNAVHLLRLRKNEDSLQQKARTIIERQVTQLTRLVDDLMEVSRITTGRVRLRLERIVVSGIVERAVETARPLMDQHRHALTVSLPPQPIWLNADASRLEQVVVNLLSNAAKYTDEGGHVWLTVQEEGAECVLRVRDTGVGIAPDLLPRIFDLFTQAERSLDRSQGGLGIGLALVYRLVEMHGGSVSVISVLGQGSEFVVRLPILSTADPHSLSSPTATANSLGPSLRVLVVDDNVDTATSLAMLLEETGHEVQIAHDGPTALDAALNYRPNVVLLDIGLPGLNGFEVAKRLRQQPVFQSIVLVAITGYGQEADRQHSLDAGFNYHLVKPTDFGKVQDILETVSKKAT